MARTPTHKQGQHIRALGPLGSKRRLRVAKNAMGTWKRTKAQTRRVLADVRRGSNRTAV